MASKKKATKYATNKYIANFYQKIITEIKNYESESSVYTHYDDSIDFDTKVRIDKCDTNLRNLVVEMTNIVDKIGGNDY